MDKPSASPMDWALKHFLLSKSGLQGRDLVVFESVLMELQQAINRGDSCITLSTSDQAVLQSCLWLSGEQK
ncbi:MAG: hypothetical protein ABGX69_07365, partial [Methylococcales bacterium]